MTRFTRFLSSVLVALLTLTALVTVTNATQFTDVPSTAPLLDAINYAVDNNFIEPTSSTTFSPNSYMTRGNMVLMLYRHSGETASSTNTGFTDVPSSSVYARAVVWAVTKGITNGTSSTTFEPNTNIKRQDAAVLMYRYAQYMVHRTDYTSTLENFTDSGRVQSYALPAMQWAVGAGIIGGTTATTLEPRVALKRGAAAAMLQRYGFSVVIPFDENNVPNDGRLHTTNDIFSRDIYGFTNSRRYFKESQNGSAFNPNSSCYYITVDDLNLMAQYVTEDDNITLETWDEMLNWIYDKTWNGSCFGMCASTVLDKAGKINVNLRQSNTMFLSQITQESANSQVESLINYYQILEELLGNTAYVVDSYNMELLSNTIDNHGFCVISILGNVDNEEESWGHALIGYKTMSLNNNEHRIYVYDPNYTTMNTYLSYKIENGSVVFNYHPNGRSTGKPIDCFKLRNANELCNEFEGYDIDGSFNTGVSETSTTSLDESNLTCSENVSIVKKSIFANMVNESKTTLYVNCNDDFTVTNSQGEYLIYDSETFSYSGNMTLYRQAVSFIDGFTHVLTVPADDSYEIITEADNVCFNVLSKNSFNGIKANSAASVKISNDEIIVSGDNAVVTSSYGAEKLNFTKEIK